MVQKRCEYNLVECSQFADKGKDSETLMVMGRKSCRSKIKLKLKYYAHGSISISSVIKV